MCPCAILRVFHENGKLISTSDTLCSHMWLIPVDLDFLDGIAEFSDAVERCKRSLALGSDDRFGRRHPLLTRPRGPRRKPGKMWVSACSFSLLFFLLLIFFALHTDHRHKCANVSSLPSLQKMFFLEKSVAVRWNRFSVIPLAAIARKRESKDEGNFEKNYRWSGRFPFIFVGS